MPWRVKHVAAVLVAARDECGRFAADRITLPTHAGQRGHPVALGHDWVDALARLGGDEGARSMLRAHAESVFEAAVGDAGCLRDVDTPADLAEARVQPAR